MKDIKYICYRPDYRKNTDIIYPKNYKLITINEEDRCNKSNANLHHWNLKFVYDTFLPIFIKDFEIPVDFKKYKYIQNVKSDGDFSYHNYNEDISFTITELLTGKKDIYSIDKLRTNNRNHYHAVFKFFHKSLFIENNKIKNGRKLFINCDSMSIPLIPFIMPYFESIIVLDNRKPEVKPVIDYRIYDYNEKCLLLLDRSFIENKEVLNLT